MKLHFHAQASGKPVLILHGLFGSLDNWQITSARLSSKFRVYTVDLRNHGKSPHNPDMDYELMATDIAELVEAEGLAAVSLIGHSLGGKVAMQFALAHEPQLDKLVIVDMAPRAYPPHHQYIFQALLSLDLAAFSTRTQIDDALAPAIPDLAVRQFLLKNLKRHPKNRFYWQINLEALHANYPRLSAALPQDKICNRPTLFLRAAKSDFIRQQDEPMIHKLFPRAEIHTIANAGHWVHADRPEDFLQAVQDFVS